ncbi:MAG: hypothetical protein COB36_12125 [Alphaproteobacteria bacterium]|nr:MAG: hypothetical protein COB36_12125 [Alphaproteobacteria bacterium]
MAIPAFNRGTAAGDGNGDTLRTTGNKLQQLTTDTTNAAAALIQVSAGDDVAGRVLTTDRLSEHVVNANGEYWKYPDGKLICTSTNGGVSGLAVAPDNTFVGSANTFPFPFFGEPRITCNGRVRSAGNIEIGPIQVNNHTPTVYTLMFRNNSNQVAEDIVEVSIIAIGNWK